MAMRQATRSYGSPQTASCRLYAERIRSPGSEEMSLSFLLPDLTDSLVAGRIAANLVLALASSHPLRAA